MPLFTRVREQGVVGSWSPTWSSPSRRRVAPTPKLLYSTEVVTSTSNLKGRKWPPRRLCVGDGTRASEPDGYLPLTPAVLDIVLALGDEELHGYAIMREVRRRTDGRRRLAPGTLYRSLRQMQERGLVEESEERPDPDLDDERRRYYRLTDLGRRVAVAEVERLEGLVRAARSKGLVPSARPSGAPGGA